MSIDERGCKPELEIGKLISVISTIRPDSWSNRASESPQYLTPDGAGKISGLQTNEAVAKYLLTKTTSSPKAPKEVAEYLPITEILCIVSDQALNSIHEDESGQKLSAFEIFYKATIEHAKSLNYYAGARLFCPYSTDEAEVLESFAGDATWGPNNDDKPYLDFLLFMQHDNDSLGLTKNLSELDSRLNPKDRVYIDSTGGQRDSVYLMLLFSRLLAYKDIRLEQVLYSEYNNSDRTNSRIKDTTYLYELFNLVSGVQEFRLSGNVQTLKTYTKSQLADNNKVSEFVDALEDFFKYLMFEGNPIMKEVKYRADKVNKTIKLLENQEDFSDGEVLLELMLPMLKASFGFSGNGDVVLSSIKWCAQHGHLYRALVLYRELIPAFLEKHGFFTRSQKLLSGYRITQRDNSKQSKEPNSQEIINYLIRSQWPALKIAETLKGYDCEIAKQWDPASMATVSMQYLIAKKYRNLLSHPQAYEEFSPNNEDELKKMLVVNTILKSNLNKIGKSPSSFINKQMKLEQTANTIKNYGEKALRDPERIKNLVLDSIEILYSKMNPETEQ